MKILATIFIALLFVSPLQAEDINNIKLLRWLESANPKIDANNAIKNGDLRLRALYGYTLYIPDTKPSEIMEYENNYGLFPIEGTSDYIENKEHGDLIKLAIEYAKQYNNIILKHSNE